MYAQINRFHTDRDMEPFYLLRRKFWTCFSILRREVLKVVRCSFQDEWSVTRPGEELWDHFEWRRNLIIMSDKFQLNVKKYSIFAKERKLWTKLVTAFGFIFCVFNSHKTMIWNIIRFSLQNVFTFVLRKSLVAMKELFFKHHSNPTIHFMWFHAIFYHGQFNWFFSFHDFQL